jgi:hypothetical protein
MNEEEAVWGVEAAFKSYDGPRWWTGLFFGDMSGGSVVLVVAR